MNRVDLNNIFRSLVIPYKETSPTALNVCCPFCVGQIHHRRDDKYLCGVFYSSLRYHCFRCKRTGSLYKLLKAIVSISRDEYEALVKHPIQEEKRSLSQIIKDKFTKKKVIKKTKKIKLPDSLTVSQQLVSLYPELYIFLQHRNISVDTCIEHEACYTGCSGNPSGMLVVPVYDRDERLVAWQGRDVTGIRKNKYFSQGNIMNYLYWSSELLIDISKVFRVYLVEGIYDCWRMKYNTIACFSHALTQNQRVDLMRDIPIDELVICFDGDSYNQALNLARDIAPIFDRVGAVKLPNGHDPDSLGEESVRNLPIKWV